MNEIQKMFVRQARWQKARKDLTWPEKIRLVERVRESARQLRASGAPELPQLPARPGSNRKETT